LEFWKKSIDYILEKNKEGIMFNERTCMIILRKILTNKDPDFTEMRSPCGAAIGQLAYNYNGDVYTCDEARMINEDLFKIGNVCRDKYKDVIKSEQVANIICASTNDCQICDNCAYKPYCGICPVCNFSEQGSIVAKILETSRCKIYKEQFTYIFNKVNDPKNREIFESWIKNFNCS
jgi:radical SAM protein with 4Fe4S-binding SPASM domain